MGIESNEPADEKLEPGKGLPEASDGTGCDPSYRFLGTLYLDAAASLS
jgi:hypothetical protein